MRRLLPAENWKPVPGYEGHYEVSDHGRVRSVSRFVDRVRLGQHQKVFYPSIIRKPTVDAAGYGNLSLTINRRAEHNRVHVLVLLAFVGPRPAGHHGCHRDGNAANNRLDNLYWGTPAENHQDTKRHGRAPVGDRHGRSKLTRAEVLRIRQLYETRTAKEIASEYFPHVCWQTIAVVGRGVGWGGRPRRRNNAQA